MTAGIFKISLTMIVAVRILIQYTTKNIMINKVLEFKRS